MKGKRGLNELISILLNYITNVLDANLTQNRVLIRNDCLGQNTNKTMVSFSFCLVHILKIFKRSPFFSLFVVTFIYLLMIKTFH